MPELVVPPLRTVALSEPLWLDGVIYAALETPARDAIIVFQNPHTKDVAGESVLSGSPTQDPREGPRAMWPRMAEWAPGWQVVYQQGTRNVHTDNGDANNDIGPAHGIWPVAVRQDPWLGSANQAATPADGSQGIFGYLDGKWWSFDAIRQSAFALAYPQGVLFHGWRDKGVLHLLFTEGSASVPDRVILCTDEGGRWNRFVVFTGRAEFPRGCSTPTGVYVHAVGEGGQYRAAMSPFPRLEEAPVPGVKPDAKIHAYESSVTLPDRAQVAVETAGDEAFLRYRVLGAQDDWTRVAIPVGKRMVALPIEEPGDYDLSVEARSQGHANAITTSPRSVLVRPAVTVPPPEAQVVTEDDLDTMKNAVAGIALDVNATTGQILTGLPNGLGTVAFVHLTWYAKYATLRASGQDHAAALAAVKDEAWAFVEAEIAKAKGEGS